LPRESSDAKALTAKSPMRIVANLGTVCCACSRIHKMLKKFLRSAAEKLNEEDLKVPWILNYNRLVADYVMLAGFLIRK
jgi:hypothetical protein